MVKRTLNYDVELTEEQDEDFSLFTRTFKGAEVLRVAAGSWNSDEAVWAIMDETRVIGLASTQFKRIVEDTRKAEVENGTELAENVLKKIKPFLPKMQCIQKKNGGVFNCLLKSGLWLIISPKIQPAVGQTINR